MAVLCATGAVVFSLILSVVYRYLAQSKLQRTNMATITTIHAFTIEALQLCVLVKGVVLCWTVLLPTQVYHYGLEASSAEPHISTWLAATGTLATHILAVFAVDLIENLIQLGTWQHPVQIQTLLLTRSMFFPSTVRRTTPIRPIRQVVPVEKFRGRSRTRKLLVSSTLSIDRADTDPTTPTKLYELEGSLPDKVDDVQRIPSTTERFMHKARPPSTPCVKRYLVVTPQTPPASVSRARVSNYGSLRNGDDPDSPASPRRATLSSSESVHVNPLYRSASAPDLLKTPAKEGSGQPEPSRTPITQTTLPTTPLGVRRPVPVTPESLPSNSKKPSPPFTCSTVSSALKVRPKAQVRTSSAQSVKRDVVELSRSSSGKVRGSPVSVRETVRLFEERS